MERLRSNLHLPADSGRRARAALEEVLVEAERGAGAIAARMDEPALLFFGWHQDGNRAW
jgi:hypothetical protein